MTSDTLEKKIKKYMAKIKRAKPSTDTSIYKEKLAYYHRISNMRGGADEDLPKPGTEIEYSFVPPEGEGEDVPEGKEVTYSYAPPGEKLISENPNEQEAEEPQQENIEKIPLPEDIRGWDDITKFNDILNKYKLNLFKLIENLNQLTPGKQDTIKNIAKNLDEISDKLKQKDQIIDNYIGVISEAQSKLDNLEQTFGNLNFNDVTSAIQNAESNIDSNIANYSAMMFIHDYLVSLKNAKENQPLISGENLMDNDEFKQVMNSVALIKRTGSDKLKTILTNLTDNEFPIANEKNRTIRDAIYYGIKK